MKVHALVRNNFRFNHIEIAEGERHHVKPERISDESSKTRISIALFQIYASTSFFQRKTNQYYCLELLQKIPFKMEKNLMKYFMKMC